MTDTGTQPPPPSDYAGGVIPPDPLPTPASLEQQHTLATAVACYDELRMRDLQRRRSWPYERSVASDRPAACRSPKNADTASTPAPARSTRRYRSHRTPVSSSATA